VPDPDLQRARRAARASRRARELTATSAGDECPYAPRCPYVGVDRADEDLINSAFHSGAVDDHGTPRPAPELARGVATGTQRQLMHFMGNVLIDLDGDTAFVESYFISFSPQDEDRVTSTRTRAGRYLDRFERRDGAWKIAHRLVVDEWARLDELTRIPDHVGVHVGVRGPEDAVYHLRERLK
jgi:hypothetical protein